MTNNEEKFEIKFDETKLSNSRQKADYLLKILKETNALSKNKQNLTIKDLVLDELHLCLQQKESTCSKKIKQLSELNKQFDNLIYLTGNQKDLTSKYENKIDIYLNNIEAQAKNELNLLTKQRIQKEIEFTKRIDQKLQKFTLQITDNTKSTEKQHQTQLSLCFKELSESLKTLKTKQQQISMKMTQNQVSLLKHISNKILELKGMFIKLESEASKLDLLLDQIQEFQKNVVSKIRKIKQQRVQKEQQTIEIIEKIISVIDSKKAQAVQFS